MVFVRHKADATALLARGKEDNNAARKEWLSDACEFGAGGLAKSKLKKGELFMEWSKMIAALASCLNVELVVYWLDGAIMKGIPEEICETCTCDTDDLNGMDYYMCIFRVIEKIKPSLNKMLEVSEGSVIEISIMNEPIKICTANSQVIWCKDF